MSNTQDQARLRLVKDEVNKTLDQARHALENFAENTDDTTQIRFCSSGLHQVRGTLQILEFFGAARMADELEKLADAVADDKVADQNKAIEVLMQGIVQMPQYLESIQRGERDIPVVLLPMVNETRKARGVEPLSESAVFTPNLQKADKRVSSAEANKAVPENELMQAAKKLRQHFQKGLLGILKNENLRESFVRMHKVIERLETITAAEKISTLWWITNGFLIVIREDMLFRNPTIHALLSHVDKQIKILAEKGTAEIKNGAPKELLKNLLYFIAKSKSKDAKVIELQRTFQLAENLPDEEKLKAQRSSLSGPDAKAIETVVAAIREDIADVRENLDVMVRSGSDSSSLKGLVEPVQKISDTLSMLGMNEPKKVIDQQIRVLREASFSKDDNFEGIEMDMAGAILFVEASLSSFLSQRLKSKPSNDGASQEQLDTAKQQQVEEAKVTLITEARSSLQKSKDAIVDFMASSFDHRIVAHVPEQIDGISSAISIVGLDKAGELLRVSADFVRNELLSAKNIPREESLEALADVFTSIDFFLEGILDNNDAGLESIIKAAAESAEILKKPSQALQEEAEPASQQEPQAPAVSAPAQSSAAVDEELISEEVIEIFLEEAEEELESIQNQLPRWMDNFEDNESLTTLRRSFHTLKGSGRLVGAQIIGELAWSIENLLNRVIDNTIEPSPNVTGAVTDAKNMLPELIEAFSKQVQPSCDSEELRLRAEALAKGQVPSAPEPKEEITEEPEVETSEATPPDEPVEQQAEVLAEPGVAEEAERGHVEEPQEVDPVLMEIFLSEAVGHISEISHFIDAAMNSPVLPKPSDGLVRALHTLKGSAHMAGFHTISRVVGPLENYVRECKNRDSKLSEEAMLVIADSSNYIAKSLEDIKQSRFVDEEQGKSLLERAEALGESLAEGKQGTVDEGERDLELFSIFLKEGNEILTDTDTILNEWIIEPALDHREKLLSEMHTLKRGANMASVYSAEDLSGSVEALLERCSSPEAWTESFFDVLKRGVGGLHDMLDSAAADQEVKPASELVTELDSFVPELEEPEHSPELSSEPVPEEEEALPEVAGDDVTDAEEPETTTEDLQRELNELSNDLNASVEQGTETLSNEDNDSPTEVSLEPEGEENVPALELAQDEPGPASDTEVYPFDDMMEIFIEEADEILENVYDTTGQWQESTHNLSLVAELQRNMHTLKGSARMAGATYIGSLGHELEDIYEALVNGKLKPTASLVKVAEEVHDTLGDMVEAVRNHQGVRNPQELIDRINQIAKGASEEQAEISSLNEPANDEIVEELSVEELPLPEENSELALEPTSIEPEEEHEAPSSYETAATNEEVQTTAEEALEDNYLEPSESTSFDEEVYPVDDLMEIFLEEAEEILDNLGETTARWQEDPNNVASVAELQRDMHTLKGSARMAGAPRVGDLGHELEFVYEAVVDGRINPGRLLIELAEHTHDELGEMVQSIINGQPVKNPEELLNAIKQLARGEPIEAIPELRGLLPSLPATEITAETSDEVLPEPLVDLEHSSSVEAETETVEEIQPELPEEEGYSAHSEESTALTEQDHESAEFSSDELDVTADIVEPEPISDLPQVEEAEVQNDEEYNEENNEKYDESEDDLELEEVAHDVELGQAETSDEEEITLEVNELPDLDVVAQEPEENNEEEIAGQAAEIEIVAADHDIPSEITLEKDEIEAEDSPPLEGAIDAEHIDEEVPEINEVIETEPESDDQYLEQEPSLLEEEEAEPEPTNLDVEGLEEHQLIEEQDQLDEVEEENLVETSLPKLAEDATEEDLDANLEGVSETDEIEATLDQLESDDLDLEEELSALSENLETEASELLAQSDEENEQAQPEIVEEMASEALSEPSDMEDSKEEMSEHSEVIDVSEEDEFDLTVRPETDEVIPIKIDEDDEEILDIYLEEAGEILEEMDGTLLEWMGRPNNREPIELILRHLHTLKGGARLSNLTAIGDLSHEIEAYFEGIDSQTKVTDSAKNTIQDGYDILAALVKQITADKAMTYPADYLARLKYVKEHGEEPELESIGDNIVASEEEASLVSSEEPSLEAIEEDLTESLEAENLDLAQDDQADQDEAINTLQASNNIESLPEKKPSSEKPEAAPQREGHMAEVVPMKLKPRSQQIAEDKQESRASAQQSPQEVVKVGSETLENLVNLAGETSIFRSRLEQQVLGLRSNLEEMGATVERLRTQLRNLEIETEAQVVYRREVAGYREYEDFDPLEMDRYTRQQELTRSLGESAADLLNLKDSLDSLASDSETLLLQQGRVNTELQERLMRTRMVPFTSVVPRLRRIVRQIGRELGKPVELSISAEGEMDRTILERMVAPIEHMLRNAIDHGIESPEKRKKAGKSETGKVKIKLFREGGEVVIRVQDDGGGINHEAIRKKALERGLISADSNLSEHELQLLILEAGFSTAEKVTQISGRGVGMDVVNSEIKQMGGVIDIDSTFGEGTLFTVSLPFTVSVNQALMVMIGEDIYAIPLSSIEGIVRVSPIELQELYSEANPEYTYAGIDYNLKYLGSLIEPGRTISFDGVTKPLPLLLLHGADKPIAVHVDDLMGSREIVVKSVGQQLSSVTGLSGASILGDGRVVLILDILAFLRMVDSQVAEVEQVEEIVTERETPLIMVVDDSITVRKVTARLLERHDYDVITAKDGVDALTVLQEHRPDVMLLDIEMPRMDGFELATIIRHDEKLKKLPIIMITSRTGEKHRTRAESIGVNHYMGKPFNESLLLETIQQLAHT